MRVSESRSWLELRQEAARLADYSASRALNDNPGDWFSDTVVEACGIRLDFSRHLLDRVAWDELYALAEQEKVGEWKEKMFSGEKINFTEQRAVLHTALRLPAGANSPVVDGEPVLPLVHEQLDRIERLVNRVHSGEWRGYADDKITDVVNIGIGGSDLGPKMVCHALQALAVPSIKTHFVSNLDPADLDQVLSQVDPRTTLFLVASKTFTTLETMQNANWAREWFIQKSGPEGEVSKHFVALSANVSAAVEFGISADSVFSFWDWVGGRFSLWSAVGTSIALALGMDNFKALLAGAHAMDTHFLSAKPAQNLPLRMALVGIWNNNFLGSHSLAVLPYNDPLGLLPDYLQQLEMESNGKRIDRDGQTVDYRTCPVIWGNIGINAQHAFYQLLHQGSHPVACDMLLAQPAESQNFDSVEGRELLVASWLGQMEAMLQGRDEDQLRAEGVPSDLMAHKFFPGDRPHTLMTMDALSPENLGALIALYEHKVFCQGIIWRVNSFDQWGVELGKKLTTEVASSLKANDYSKHDQSTQDAMMVCQKNKPE